MAKLKHQGNFETCVYCKQYVDFWSITKLKVVAHIKRLHERSIVRQDQEQVMRDCGLVKVKGVLGGTYWE